MILLAPLSSQNLITFLILIKHETDFVFQISAKKYVRISSKVALLCGLYVAKCAISGVPTVAL